MRISVCLMVMMVSCLLLSPSSRAEDKKGFPSLSLMAGGYLFEDQVGLKNEPVYGARIGYEIAGKSFDRRLGIEAVYQRVDGHADALDADIDVTMVRLDALYLFNAMKKVKRLTPFVAIGGGGQFFGGDLGSRSDPLVAYGAGFKLPLGSALALRADVRHVMIFADEQRNEFEYTAGLEYTFGKPKKVRPRKPADSDADQDGVVDARDQCPDTPQDLKVDRQGCPVNPPDTDKDGVADYLDLCPATRPGYPVDERGCLIDSDGDGVADPFDECPNNPPGFPVDENGCMKISQ